MNEFKILHIDQLKLDTENPRLPNNLDKKEIITYLATKTNIKNLMISIGTNDFFSGESIVVTPIENNKYIVLEGNRRVAALRLLQNPGLVGEIISIKKISEESEYKPVRIPAYIVEKRYDALQYLGFRHISGVQRWDPLAKARYMKLVFDQTSGEPEDRYVQVAREIGSQRNAVRRNLDALAAYNVIRERDFYEILELNRGDFKFGVFYTAIGDIEIASFVGIRKDGKPTHPIVNEKYLNEESLLELTNWMFKKDSRGDTRLGDSRNIGKLSAVIVNSNALEMLRQGVSLGAAYSATSESRQNFLYNANEAIYHLKQANSNLHSVSSEHQKAMDAVQEIMSLLDVAIQFLKIERQ